MSGADAFPYPDDDPGTVRGLGTSLSGRSGSLGPAVTRVRDARGSLLDRWTSPAGGLAVAEVDAVGGLGDEAVTALADAQAPLDDYANALETARDAIDVLRSQYDDAEADHLTALDGIETLAPPLRQQERQFLLGSFNSRTGQLTTQYDEAITVLASAARRTGDALGEIAGRISPAPQSLNGDLARASALDRLPFMTDHDGTEVVRTDDLILIDTGNGNDDVRVSRDPDTGAVAVTVNGTVHYFTAEEAQDIVIRTNGGSDVIEVSRDIQLGFTLLAGEDNDLVAGGEGTDVMLGGGGDDTIVGGRGNDAMDGGDGQNHLQDSLDAATAAALMTPFGSRGVSAREGGGDDVIAGGDDSDRIDAGTGNDTIDAGAGDDQIQGGDGDDTIDAGAGNDYVDGYRGNDTIDGDDDEDVIYAGEGNDDVDGGEGDDYVDGFHGDDNLSGGGGQDVVSGGAGNDTLAGDAGDDVVYTGAGRDAVTDHSGNNTIYLEPEDVADVNHGTQRITVEIAAVPGNIHVEGSPEFQARVWADLETLASSPTGQQMLEQIGQEGEGLFWTTGDQLTIVETPDISYAEWPEYDALPRNDSTIRYNPSFRLGADNSPITVLFHEMAHSYDMMSDNVVGYDDGARWYVGPDARQAPPNVDANQDGHISFDEVDLDDDGDIDDDDLDLDNDGDVDEDDGWLRNLERQAVGLPVDHDQNPATPDIPADDVPGIDHPDALTENALRGEMGDPRRDSY